jgi:hypothetical protein
MGTSSDDAARDRSRKAINSLSKETKKIGKFLLGVIDGTEKDEHTTKDGKVVMKPAPLNVRVQAAKTYKEMVLDKLTPDVKDNQKKVTTEGKSMVAALKELHEKSQLKK